MLFLLSLLLFTAACKTFRRGHRLFLEKEYKKSEPILKRKTHHRIWGPGARYDLDIICLTRAQYIWQWDTLHRDFTGIANELKRSGDRQRNKLGKYKITSKRTLQTRDAVEDRVITHLCQYPTILNLDSVLALFPDWQKKAELDSMRRLIVNYNLNPKQALKHKLCEQADPLGVLLPLQKQPCTSEKELKRWPFTYDDILSILKNHNKSVDPANYAILWEAHEQIWELFHIQHPYCDMAEFKKAFPYDQYAIDCSFDTARDTLCMDQLKPLLRFHQNNPHTALDIDICNHITCIARTSPDVVTLNAYERQRLSDIVKMAEIQEALRCNKVKMADSTLIHQVADLARAYPHHRAVYELMELMSNHFFSQGKMASAQLGIDSLRALFPDQETCPARYSFQIGKQKWFENYQSLLRQVGKCPTLARPVKGWNTPENDEYGLVSWGEEEEVYFARRNQETGAVVVMTSSEKKQGEWSKPVPIPQLSLFTTDITPLSITADGRLMLLKGGGKLWQAQRHTPKRVWSAPQPLPLSFGYSGNATLSPDGEFLFIEKFANARITPTVRPNSDIYVSKMGDDNRFGTPTPINKSINLPDSDEGNPLLAVGGRMLLFTSNRDTSLGNTDIYSVVFNEPYQWDSLSAVKNMGVLLNTVFDDSGLSFLSEYTGQGYFHREDQCDGNLDIWEIPVKQNVPEAIRLAGLLVDENNKPITGGFMEFTSDYSLKVNSRTISPKGTYSYTAPNNSRVIRLFPEIAGYYSERDTTHYLDWSPKGAILHDTFHLISFEYIRKNFKLNHATFINGTDQFDQPAQSFPELTRLAKIATRMGAEMELSGHSDNVGTEKENYQLSLNRTNAVKQFLVEKCGFAADKIKVMAFGDTQPLVPNTTEEGRRRNRRVEVAFKMPPLPAVPQKKPQTGPCE